MRFFRNELSKCGAKLISPCSIRNRCLLISEVTCFVIVSIVTPSHKFLANELMKIDPAWFRIATFPGRVELKMAVSH